MPSPFAHAGGNFNFEYTTASGGVANLVTTNAQRGVNAAAMLLGTGVWWIRPGANVAPAFAQKYFAIYSQNDWRPTPKLTVNLGLRWEVQPGPTERFNRMSSWDFTRRTRSVRWARSRSPASTVTAATCGTRPTTTRVRASAPPTQLNEKTVAPRRLRHHLSADQHRLFLRPDRLRLGQLLGRLTQQPYGTNPRGVPVIRFSDPAPIAPAIGGDPDAPQVYGIGEARFDRHFENGQAQAVERLHRALALQWLDDVDRLQRHRSAATC